MNEAAYSVYELDGSPFYLSQASQWIKKVMAYRELPNYYDTYARLLHKDGKIKEAIIRVKKVVDMVNQSPHEVFNLFEAVLQKMKNGD